MKRDFISLSSFTREEIGEIFSLTGRLKNGGSGVKPLAGKTAALIFEKQSLRTYVSFAVGVAQLGGQSVFLSQQQIGLATREAVRDIAEVLSRYNDLIVARTMAHSTVLDLARFASVPVVNALTDLFHPCQIMADAFTLIERDRFSGDTTIAFIGDGNNVANSWIELAGKLPFHLIIACPKGYEPDATVLAAARAEGAGTIEIVHDPLAAAKNADVLYTDVWVSMGQEAERAAREKAFKGFQINDRLLKSAPDDCLVMHCLPAHRGEEITAEALEGKQSIALDQAENRLHVQKAIMTFLFGGEEASNSNKHARTTVSGE